MTKPVIPEKPVIDGPPPVLGSWRNVYIFVLSYSVLVMFLFWLFTEHYRPR